jgi:hypothetical protein
VSSIGLNICTEIEIILEVFNNLLVIIFVCEMVIITKPDAPCAGLAGAVCAIVVGEAKDIG